MGKILEKGKTTTQNKLQIIINTLIIPLIPMILWVSLFPMIKIGYDAFGIEGTSIADILMFASLRFSICGVLLCVWSYFKKEQIEDPKGKSIFYILLMGFFAIVLHYAFTYIGLAYTDSSKTALLKQLGVLLYICFAFLFVRDEKFNKLKIAGALVGFAGIIAINTTGGKVSFAFGDILIILASVCTVVSSILTRITAQKSSPFWITGISQLGGGAIMLVAALVMGGKVGNITPWSVFVFVYICSASIAAYVLWTYLMRTVSLSRLFIIKFAEPLFACIFGAIFLGENIFKMQYLLAFVLISAGIALGNID